MKVYIVHPSYDYGVHSVHSTREGAQIAMDAHEEAEWAAWQKNVAEAGEPPSVLRLVHADFIGQHYIAEFEVDEVAVAAARQARGEQP